MIFLKNKMDLLYSTYRFSLKIILILFIIIFPKLLIATPPQTTTLEDIAYHPVYDSDSYIEAWNFTHIQKNLRIYVTFLISNLGPGDMNNGISILMYHDGKSQVITAEYAQHSLTAKPGKFGVKSGRSFFKSCGNHCIQVKIILDEIEINLKLNHIKFGPKLSEREIIVSNKSTDYINAFIPVHKSQSSGHMRFGDKHFKLAGISGMEYLLTNRSPHKYAKSINLIRSFGSKSLALGFMDTASDFKQKKAGRILVKKNNQILFHDYISKRNVLSKKFLKEFDLSIPQNVEYITQNNPCKISIHNKKTVGAYNVLGNISVFLRWVLQAFYAKPHIIYFTADASISCKVNGNWKTKYTFSNIESSFYIINE